MTPSEILFDAIAELIALEPRRDDAGVSLSLKSLVFSLCVDTGISQQEITRELETRVQTFRLQSRQMRVVSGSASQSPA